MVVFQAFAELQVKAIETSKNLRIADVLIDNLKRRKQHASITERLENVHLTKETAIQ